MIFKLSNCLVNSDEYKQLIKMIVSGEITLSEFTPFKHFSIPGNLGNEGRLCAVQFSQKNDAGEKERFLFFGAEKREGVFVTDSYEEMGAITDGFYSEDNQVVLCVNFSEKQNS